MRTQGRSSAPGAAPGWIEAAADYMVEIKPGSTILELEVPSLLEASPETFGQSDFLSEVDPQRSSFHYFRESLEAAVAGQRDSPLYDRGLLEVFRRFEKVVGEGAERITLQDERTLVLTSEDLQDLATLEAAIPPPQYVRVAGKLDQIRASDRTFTVRSLTHNQTLKGIAQADQKQQLQDLWGQTVLVGGTAHFTPAGGLLRIEADHIRRATGEEESRWGAPPRSLGSAPAPQEFREPQGTRSGLAAIIGKWPGDESDEEIAEALEQLS